MQCRKNYIFFLLLYLISSVLSICTFAKNKTHYISIGHSATYDLIRDKGISALSYTNFIHGFDITYAQDDSTIADIINVYYHKGKLENSNRLFDQPETWKFQFSWKRYWRTNWLKNTRTDFGFHLHHGATNQHRNDFPNNSDYFNELLSIGPAIQLKKYWYPPSEKKVEFYCQTSFALLSYIVRPSIASTIPINNVNKDNVGQETLFTGKITTIHQLQNVNTTLGMNFFIAKFIFISADYSWEFIHYNQDNEYHEVNHRYFIRLGFYF
jgi:hypothetical protein